jgi:hypothetical protein
MEAAKAALNGAATKDKCALTIASSHGTNKPVYVACKLFGECKEHLPKNAVRKRMKRSLKVNCQFLASIRYSSITNYTIMVNKPFHTGHPPSHEFILHELREMNEEQKQLFQYLAPCPIGNRAIYNILLNKYPSMNITVCDIRNERNKLKVKNNEEKMNNLISNMKKACWKYSLHYNDSGDINSFLIIPYTSIILFNAYPNVHLIDTTFSTNKENFLLIEGIGVSNTFHSFIVFFCFSSFETCEMYDWMFSSLKDNISGFCPNIISTDKHLGLLKSIHQQFPLSKHLLCVCLLIFLSFYFINF